MVPPLTQSKRSLLVVDDEADTRTLLSDYLSAEGFDLTLAQSVKTAQARLAGALPDLVITDVGLPGAPPFAVLDLIEADERTRDLPVLVCTGGINEAQEAAERFKRPDRAVLFKPFEIDDLLASIERLLAANPAEPGRG